MAIPAESDKPTEQPPSGVAPTRELKPMEVDLGRIVLLGTVLYAIAAAVLLPMQSSLTHDGHGRWPWIAVSGVGLGLLGYFYVKRRDRAIARDAAARAATED
ncbi:MAG TPA: DUF2530 domain-containing protein [Actinospica sp.]|nr:DUF2530 domain-containing protein [Actinospica sp.]